jgi:hypothetical protein
VFNSSQAKVTKVTVASSSSARPASQKAASSRRSLRGVLAVLVVAAIVAAAIGASAYFGRTPQPVVSETQATTVSSITRKSDDPITVIISSPNRNDCRRYQLHNTTGAMSDKGVSDCMRDPDEASGQGTRIEEISKGFRNR